MARIGKGKVFLTVQVLCQGEDFQKDGQAILAAFREWIEAGAGGAEGWELEKENHEGWRVSVDEGEGRRGWALLRASLHDPLLVLNVESDRRGGAPLSAASDFSCLCIASMNLSSAPGPGGVFIDATICPTDFSCLCTASNDSALVLLGREVIVRLLQYVKNMRQPFHP